MNDDLISKNAVLETLCDCCSCATRCNSPCITYDQISKIPISEANREERGTWRFKQGYLICSKCSFSYFYQHVVFKQCPNCNHKMNNWVM